MRCRPASTTASTRSYDVEIAGRPETRRKLEVEWTAGEQAHLQRWLLWSSLVTLGLVALLLVVALTSG